MRIALFEPDIPQNLGAFIRLSACLAVPLEIIEPCALGEDARDALWLYAWGCIERHRPFVPAA